MTPRVLSAYEKNHLLKYGFDPDLIDTYDQMPVEYITGWVHFRHHDFKVSPAVLIPRVETEELISLIIANLNHRPARLADVGTGSGVIGLSLAQELSQGIKASHLYLSDISPEALHIAKDNARRLIPQVPVSFLTSDLLADYPPQLEFDVIVANLPYVPLSAMTSLEPAVKDYEPWLALDGGDLGVELIHRLLAQVSTRLTPDGHVWLEIDESHTSQHLDPTQRFEVQIFPDSFGKNRFARLALKR